MQDVRKQDPTYTNFVPKTAAEAVDRYVRCRKNGLKPMLVPECLIACAGGLKGAELDKFEDWIINPNADLDEVDLVPFDSVRLANDAVYHANLLKHTTPPLPAEFADEDDEKMPLLTAAVRDSLDLSPVAL
jgi:hypothetical protein